MQPAALAAGQVADEFLLVCSFKIEASQIGAGTDFIAAYGEDILAVGDGFPDGFFIVQVFPALFHEGDVDGFPQLEFALVGLFRAGYDPEQGGFPRAVAADNADDGRLLGS